MQIVLNNAGKLLEKHKVKVSELFAFIKSYVKVSVIPQSKSKKAEPLFWFINLKKDKIAV
jgi:hypothetical protein